MKRGTLPDALPALVPKLGNHAGRRLARWIVTRCGWSLGGEFPDVPRLVLIAAPHSSWWDRVWGLLIKVAIGIDISFMAKRELFVGPLGWMLRKLGGIPIERSSTRMAWSSRWRHAFNSPPACRWVHRRARASR